MYSIDNRTATTYFCDCQGICPLEWRMDHRDELEAEAAGPPRKESAHSAELVESVSRVLQLAQTLGLSGSLRPVLTVDEAAELLAVNKKTLYALIGRRELPGVRRVGRCVRISTEALLTWMYKGRGGGHFSR
jgi:excisionase family DNA binding protein